MTPTDTHTTQIETITRGDLAGHHDLHIYHRYVCSCGVTGHWGHSLWAAQSRACAEGSARRHVSRMLEKEEEEL